MNIKYTNTHSEKIQPNKHTQTRSLLYTHKQTHTHTHTHTQTHTSVHTVDVIQAYFTYNYDSMLAGQGHVISFEAFFPYSNPFSFSFPPWWVVSMTTCISLKSPLCFPLWHNSEFQACLRGRTTEFKPTCGWPCKYVPVYLL